MFFIILNTGKQSTESDIVLMHAWVRDHTMDVLMTTDTEEHSIAPNRLDAETVRSRHPEVRNASRGQDGPRVIPPPPPGRDEVSCV